MYNLSATNEQIVSGTQVVAIVERRKTASLPADGRQAIYTYDKLYTYMTSYERI